MRKVHHLLEVNPWWGHKGRGLRLVWQVGDLRLSATFFLSPFKSANYSQKKWIEVIDIFILLFFECIDGGLK